MDVVCIGYRTDLVIRRAEGSQVTDCGDHIVVRTERNVVLTASSVIQPRLPRLAATVRQLAGDDDWRQSGELRLAWCRRARGLARYQDVETHPEFRRQALAGTLVGHAGRYGLADLGAVRLVMVADPDYHAFRLYESLGFRRTEDQVGFEQTP